MDLTGFSLGTRSYRLIGSPGVHYLRDPRTGTFNFGSHLHRITQPEEFDFGHIPAFIPASLDTSLHALAVSRSAKYTSSTSSISPTMSLLYFLLSKGRLLNFNYLSQEFRDKVRTFTALTRAPLAVVIRPHPDSVKSILIEKLDVESILSKLGQTLERFLTEDPADFDRMLLKNRAEDEPMTSGQGSFHYTQCEGLLLRSQIDCRDPRLPRNTFDLKTRATLPIRMDLPNYTKYLDYQLDRTHGVSNSFERELYDMARSAFLKYNLQARIGGMDGIFVAYHNTAELFGFQYLPRETIDECIFGSAEAGDLAFKLLLSAYGHILEVVLAEVPTTHTSRLTWSLAKDYSRIDLFLETFTSYPAERRAILPPADCFRQYSITSVCRLGGVLTDAFPGCEDPVQLRRSKLSSRLNIALVTSPSRHEFELARSKCGEARFSAGDLASAGVMRQLLHK